MRQFFHAPTCLLACSLALGLTWNLAQAPARAQETAAQDGKFTAEQIAFYEKEVAPLLQAHCYKCHGGDKARGGLRLTHRSSLLTGGDLGPAIDLEHPEQSILLEAIGYAGDLKMPPDGQLPADKQAILKQWILAGAPFPKDRLVAPDNPDEESAPPRKTWAFGKLQRPEVPAVKNQAWIVNPIDAFILAKLEAEGLTPAPPADKIALLRRVHYDLTGLPPTVEEVQNFLQDASPNAYERVIEQLLESPHYGEKWGRHWLDVVHFAETNGYERDGPKPQAWRYRDYVIQSFNQDKPFDQFIHEQLAGDEIPGENPDHIIATAYYRLGLWDDEPVDPLQARYDQLDDIVATTSQVFLGMTMNCARCHDHKIDPLPQTDYYRLLAFFQDVPVYSDTRDVSSRFNLTDITPKERRQMYEADLQQREKRIDELRTAMRNIEDAGIRKMPAEDQRAAEGLDRQLVIDRKLKMFVSEAEWTEYTRLKGEHDKLKNAPKPPRELALSINHCTVPAPTTHVKLRGNAHADGDQVEPGYPEVLGFSDPQLAAPEPQAKSTGRRTVLANWIASPENQMTSRVFVNRIWQHHFGRGIVPTPNDFGKFGEAPTHPELLDWLAAEFLAGNWKIKRMHKLILLSNTYRQSSQANAAALQKDPANHWLWRFPMRRLTAEEVRDSILAVSGALNSKMGGPSIYPPISRDVLHGQSRPGEGWHTSSPEEAARRSVYVHIKRSLQLPILATHDMADTDTSCPVRYNTIVATQALGLLNGEFAQEQSAALAERLRSAHPDNVADQVRLAIRLTTGREPAAAEVEADCDLIARLQEQGKISPERALQYYCLLALNTNEFVYLD